MILTSSMKLARPKVSWASAGEAGPGGISLVPVIEQMSDLVQTMARYLVDAHWNTADLALIEAGLCLVGKNKGKALTGPPAERCRQLGWSVPADALGGAYADSRVQKLAAESAMVLLDQGVESMKLLRAVVACLDASLGFDWKAFRRLDPASDKRAVWGMRRAIESHVKEHGVLPSELVQVRDQPNVPRRLLLGAVDHQMARLDQAAARDGMVRVQLKVPTALVPTKADYQWLTIEAPVPAYFRTRHPGWEKMCLPTIRFVDETMILDVAIQEQVPDLATETPTVVLSGDWGVTIPYSVGILKVLDGRIFTDGVQYKFTGDGLFHKQLRLQKEQEQLQAKITHLRRLAEHNQDPVTKKRLTTQADGLDVERDRKNSKRKHINRELSFEFANYMVSLALAVEASAIYLEDLASLEAVGRGPGVNRISSQSCRAQCVAALRPQAAKHGIRVHTVPAAGTSADCPGCGKPLSRPAYEISLCEPCQIKAHRDATAQQKIGQRGITGHHPKLRRDHEIRTSTFAPVHKTRRKFGPTPQQHHSATRKRRPTPRSTSTAKPRISAVPRSTKGRLGRACSPPGQGTHHSSLQQLALDREINTYSYAKTWGDSWPEIAHYAHPPYHFHRKPESVVRAST